jgi:hypothetical protein
MGRRTNDHEIVLAQLTVRTERKYEIIVDSRPPAVGRYQGIASLICPEAVGEDAIPLKDRARLPEHLNNVCASHGYAIQKSERVRVCGH